MIKYGLAGIIVAGIGMVFLAQPSWAASKVEKILCRNVANYVPGVDVHGNPVAPADLPLDPAVKDDVIFVPLTIDLAQKITGVAIPEGAKLDAIVGKVGVHRSGKIEFSGNDISMKVADYCGVKPQSQMRTLEAPKEPVAGAVVMSTTGPEARPKYNIRRQTVNR